MAFAGSPAFAELDRAARLLDPEGPMIVVDTYPGTDLADLARITAAELPAYRVVDVEDTAARPIAEIDGLIARNLTDDRVFGVMSHHRLPELYDPERLSALRSELATDRRPTVLLGWGAALVGVPDAVLVLADLARWEIQQRQRAGAPSWRCDNGDEDPLRKVKRGYFVEWRIADRHKVEMIFDQLDYVLDTTRVRDGEATSGDVTMIDAATFRAGLDQAVAGPLRLVPFFDPGVWGGQWMRQALDLPEGPPNYAWCFDCVPEENSLLLQAGDVLVELPAMDLVLTRPRALMGERTVARFGAEFPIRFDFLDTVGGQNLSLQVHPSTEYIRDRFGMAYTQDESYYLLDAEPGAVVYLGLTDDTDPQEMMAALRAGQAGEPFEAERFVNAFPAAKHDHFSIPAGTVHCSGADSMVLEISATPYLFTFKMWDWDRLGLDGKPRPIHLDHAERNVAWERRTDWVGRGARRAGRGRRDRARAGPRSGPDCTPWSSSRCVGTGSPSRWTTTRPGR